MDPEERVLLCSSKPVPLRESLRYFAPALENCGHVLRKEELIERLWPDSFGRNSLVQHSALERRWPMAQASSA